MKTILLVDDEDRMLDLLTIYLSKFYFTVKAKSGVEAIARMKQKPADLILLDIMMPDLDGWETCKQIKAFSDAPIIMLTARNEKIDVVKGLKMGADDYITKPFDEEELLARIDTVLRRSVVWNKDRIYFEGLIWDEGSHELTYKGQDIQVTPKEFSLLGLLIKNKNKVFSRDHLLEVIWGNTSFTEYRTIDSHMRNIREKLRQADFPVDMHLETVWGVGYKWTSK